MSHRPTVYGTRHAVSAGHYLAAAAAFSILEAGGKAIDAGCAAGIALGVLQPDLVNVAGVAPRESSPVAGVASENDGQLSSSGVVTGVLLVGLAAIGLVAVGSLMRGRAVKPPTE